MKYLKSLALLISLSALASCSQGFEDFPADAYSTMSTKAAEPTDTTGTSQISIIIDEPEVVDIDCTITLP